MPCLFLRKKNKRERRTDKSKIYFIGCNDFHLACMCASKAVAGVKKYK
jgi:hypothetical protein